MQYLFCASIATNPVTLSQDGHPHDPAYVGMDEGILAARQELNTIHRTLAQPGYNEVFVDKLGSDIVAVVRHSPHTHRSVIMVARLVIAPAL